MIQNYLAKILGNFRKKQSYQKDLQLFSNQYDQKRGFILDKNHLYPCLEDKTGNTGFDRSYLYFPAWAFRKVMQYNPEKHVDISSSLIFSALLSAVIPVDFYDYRPAIVELKGLSSKKADLNNLPFKDDSIKSLSCMHVIEHIGLGRYGDKIDADGDLKAVKELVRVLKRGGNLLFVVPIGKPVIAFNAHRIYSYNQVIDMFKDLKLKEFSLIEESTQNGLIENADPTLADKQNYGCGCFWFTKE